MSIPSIVSPKLLVTFSLVANSLSFAYACSPALDAKPASITEKTQNSTYVFDGVVTEMTDKYIKIEVAQYFKGMGASEVKLPRRHDSCSDQFELKQRALFFADKSKTVGMLNAVYDGAFGSIRQMTAKNFSQVAATKECMATYENGVLTTPCIIHQETKNTYDVKLKASADLIFSLATVAPSTSPKNAECLAVYKGGNLTVPCVAHEGSQKVYHAQLVPADSPNLKLSIRGLKTVDNIQHTSHFDKGIIGTVPDQWKAGITGLGVEDWKLVEDISAPSSPLVLKQSGEGDFPWCVKENTRLTDGFISVKFKPISGKIDQAAGLVWRWKDADNYYVARANALEDNISIYYVEDGQRHTIHYETLPSELPVKHGIWQSLRVDFTGNHFIISFEGKEIIDLKDNSIKGSGSVGVWTKQDSVISFDDFTYGK